MSHNPRAEALRRFCELHVFVKPELLAYRPAARTETPIAGTLSVADAMGALAYIDATALRNELRGVATALAQPNANPEQATRNLTRVLERTIAVDRAAAQMITQKYVTICQEAQSMRQPVGQHSTAEAARPPSTGAIWLP